MVISQVIQMVILQVLSGRIIRLNSNLSIDETFSGNSIGFNSVLYDGESIIEQS
jgi:hypothetical protein